MQTCRVPKRCSPPQRRSPRLSKLQRSPSCEEEWGQAPRGVDPQAAAWRGEAGSEGCRVMNGWQWWTFMALSAAVTLGSIVVLATLPGATNAELRLCDKTVSTVLSSTDPVELQRAGIIVHN